jgi:L-amino acid N-acyltransferase YncA
MKIRHADSARDAAGCAALYGPFVEATPISLEDRVPTAADFAARINRIEQTHPWLVAEHGDRVAGFAYGCPHRERAGYRWAAEVTVYVDPAFQRRGVGRGLYRCLFDLLGKQGLWVACAGIGLPNEASVSLHESLGFVAVGVYRNIGHKLGRWWDVGWWQLALREPGEDRPAEPGPPVRLQLGQTQPEPGV